MMTKQTILLCLILMICLMLCAAQPTPPATSSEGRLLKFIFQDYNPNARPVVRPTDSVSLKYDIALKQILEIDEKLQVVTFNFWVRQYWTDPLLRWNPSDWNGTAYVAVSPDTIWKPDITLYNNAEREFQGFDAFGKTRVTIYSDGSCVWLLPIILRSQCKMNLLYFPFDEQYCPLVFGSWAYDGGALNLTNRSPEGDLSSFSESGEFNIGPMKAVKHTTLYGCCPNPYYTIEYTVHMIRRAKFYLFNLVIPGVLIALLTIFSFFLPPLCGERTGLIITNFLSLSVYILMVSDNVPPSSNIPLLVEFYTILISEIGIALILNCMIIPLAARNTPMPYIIKKIFLQKLAYVTLCRRPDDVRIDKIQNENNEDKLFNNGYLNSTFNENIIFANNKHVVTSNGKIMTGDHKQNGNHGYHNLMNNAAPMLRERRVIKVASADEPLYEMSDKLSAIHDIMKDDVSEKKNSSDWEQLTLVLDRFFFAIFFVTIFVSVGAILGKAPKITM
ncbi:neuronal acetylcholine receptor subunit alpha-3-like isoform X2 [Clytia hemisphaerica]